MAKLYSKEELRIEAHKLLGEISKERREEASFELTMTLAPLFLKESPTLSFSSLLHEIDTSILNKILMDNKKLLLPRAEGDELIVYAVEDEEQLERASFGILEPNPGKCKKIPIEKISIILVPGLLFDQRRHRLGHGKGYYDRFLKKITKSKTIGVGFTEQLYPNLIPTTEHDVTVQELYLF